MALSNVRYCFGRLTVGSVLEQIERRLNHFREISKGARRDLLVDELLLGWRELNHGKSFLHSRYTQTSR
jgi:hypothetical protein